MAMLHNRQIRRFIRQAQDLITLLVELPDPSAQTAPADATRDVIGQSDRWSIELLFAVKKGSL
jgi:hypothetical protein